MGTTLSVLVHFEMQALCQYVGGARIIIPHAHGIASTDNPGFDPVATMATLTKAGHWHSALGGRPIDSAKNLRRRRNGRPYQTDTRHGYPADLALRMAKGLSLIPVEDTYLGIRRGGAVRRDLMIHLRRWHARRTQPAIPLMPEPRVRTCAVEGACYPENHRVSDQKLLLAT